MNLKIGVRAHDIGLMHIDELSKKVSDYHFDGAQLVFNKAFGKSIDEIDLAQIEVAFKGKIMMLGAYFNMIHPEKIEVQKGIANFKKHLKIAKKLDAKFVGTETGSLMGSPWNYVPENHSDESFEAVVKVTDELLSYAAHHEAYVALEGAYAHAIYSPKRMFELVNRLNHPNLKVTIDLYNFLNVNNHQSHLEIFEESLELLKDHIVIFHLKDYILMDQKLIQVGLGQGLMKYDQIIPLIKKNHPEAYLIFEGVKKEDLESSYKFIKNILTKEGDN